MSYYGQPQQDNQQQRGQFNFDAAYSYLQQQLTRYRNSGDFVPQELRPTDPRMLDDLDRFTDFAINELPHYWAQTTKTKLVAVIEATMQDRQLGTTGCALSVFVGGTFKLRYERNLSDINAFEEGMLLYGAWFAMKNRWQMRMDRQAETEFMQHANYFDGLLNNRQNNNRSGNRNYGNDQQGGGFNLNQARQEATRSLNYEDRVANMNQQNRPTYQPPPNMNIQQGNHMQQPPQAPQAAQQPTVQQPVNVVPLSSASWTNKKISHPPCWYGKAVAAMIDSEGNVSMTPASLALPPETPSILRLGDVGNFGDGPAFDTTALVSMVGFTDKITQVPVEKYAFINPAKYAVTTQSKPNTVVVSLRAKQWELTDAREANAKPLERIRQYFHKHDTTIMDLVTYMKHVRQAKNETDIMLTDAYYWNINNVCSDMFRLMSELMLGIDPYALRLGCFGPTGKPEDEDDVETYMAYVKQTMGDTYADLLMSTSFARIFAELVFPTHSGITKAVDAEISEVGGDYFTAPFAVERYAYINNISILNDLRMIKWRSVGNQESPYGYAPARIDKAVCPALYDLASGVLGMHSDYRVPMATLNFGYGKLIVTKSFIGNGIVGKWVTFVN